MPSGQNLKAFRSATSVTRQLRIWIKLGKSSLKDVPSSGSQYLTLSNIITPGHWGLPRGAWETTLWPSRFSELICKAALIFPEYHVCGLPSKHSLTLIIFGQKGKKKKVLYINKKSLFHFSPFLSTQPQLKQNNLMDTFKRLLIHLKYIILLK